MTKSRRLDQVCPHCGYQSDRISDAEPDSDETPGPGDISMCIGCGEFGEFDATMTLCKPSIATQAAMMTDPTVANVRRAWRKSKGLLQ